MSIELGLRQRKKQLARRLISQTASRLFADRGFDAVTVAEVARAADFSEVTVFTYFPTKEDLFFGGMESFEEKLVAAVRDRAVGESVLRAFRRPLLDGCKNLGVKERAEAIARGGALINASPALQTREREISARYTQLLAGTPRQRVACDPGQRRAVGRRQRVDEHPPRTCRLCPGQGVGGTAGAQAGSGRASASHARFRTTRARACQLLN